MPYTLAKYLGWLIPAVLAGGVFGWLLARRKSTTTTATTSSFAGATDTAEVDRLRARVANLEAAVAERDKLKLDLDDCRATSQKNAAAAKAAADAARAEVEAAREAAAAAAAEAADAKAAALHSAPAVASAAAVHGLVSTPAAEPVAAEPVAEVAPPMPDLDAAAAVLGRKIHGNDLKVVEGIGPKIEELCHAKGILSWWDLSKTETATLVDMLNEAGPRFQMHDPATWPQQAHLLATGAWQEFKELTDRLDGGRAAD